MSHLETLQKIISEQFGFEEITIKADSTFESLGADSLDVLEVVISVEAEYDIEIADETVEGFKTVADIVSYLDRNSIPVPLL